MSSVKINDVNQLQCYIIERCPSVTVRNALAKSGGKFEHLGAFKPAPGSNRPGFVSRVTTSFGQQHYVAVTVYDFDVYNCYVPDHVDWSTYVGGCSHLYNGDKPGQFRTFKDVGRVDNLIESEDKNEEA